MAELLIHYKYLILFPLAVIEGPVVALTAGFFVHMGYLAVVPSCIIMFFGDIVPDSIYFFIGKATGRTKFVKKYSGKLKVISANFEIIEKLWRDHPRKTMFFSKLAYGLTIPFLVSAGLVKMSWRKFIEYTIPATIFQYGLLMIVGYYLGHSYELAIKYIKFGGIGVAVVLAAAIVAYIFMIKYAKKKIIEMEHE